MRSTERGEASGHKIMRDLCKMQGPNDGTRTLFESIMSVEVIAALKDWREAKIDAVLIGTLALDFCVKPMFEDEVFFLVPPDHVMPATITGFERMGARTFRHASTGTDMHLQTAACIGLPPQVTEYVFQTSTCAEGITVASASGLGAILLFDRRSRASADIVELLKLGLVDLSGIDLPEEQMARLTALRKDAERERLFG